MHKYHNISDTELLDFLIRYTEQFTQIEEEEDLSTCKRLIHDIIKELKRRKEISDLPNSSIK